mmetsp:Transcript_28541/g.79791  ORF Transcript_28541/g.79791 Transcript_28541/m.79791 type:complete len:548 (-) Transcript_28541:151-1794(-)|eukprot:CAMPEP_0119133406 /NCGR_PEP_ID=MMETSP1310-20130426/13354_1 /TAXON_ID=464262 /ORGANISM="Genus nov. species nov., Strain RCC2339" /LENGTH=547 /DNA_ID=CAMNT_0007124093 /DNA_START=48 /DNA_END=1691 /DNA_ORIENTATION=-
MGRKHKAVVDLMDQEHPRWQSTERLIDDAVTKVEERLMELVHDMKKNLVKDIEEAIGTPPRGEDGAGTSQKMRMQGHKRKEFRRRESILVSLLRFPDFQTLYNMCFAILAWLFLSLLVKEYFDTGSFSPDLNLLSHTFGQLDVALREWAVLFALTFTGVPLNMFLWLVRSSNLPAPVRTAALALAGGIYLCIHVYLFVRPVRLIEAYSLPPGSCAFILAEQARHTMKLHSYVREKWRAMPAARPAFTEELRRFLYFSFAPTLLYRDEYPRNPRIRWWRVVSHAGEVAAGIIYGFVFFSRFVLIPEVQQANTYKQYLEAMLAVAVPATFILLVAHFLVLHSWQNVFGELTRFADRHFYEDWWNVPGFQDYYRKWNLIVHEWLFTYIYQEVRDLARYFMVGSAKTVPQPGSFVRTFSSGIAKWFTFVISGVIHETLLGYSIGFFVPMLGVQFVFAAPPLIIIGNFVEKNLGNRVANTLLWFLFLVGNGSMTVFFCREYYVRSLEPATYNVTEWLYHGPGEAVVHSLFSPETEANLVHAMYPHSFSHFAQ